MINVASIQMKVDDNGKEANVMKANRLIDESEAADLILLPEMWSVGYFAFSSYKQESESLEGPTISMLRDKARQKGCFIFGGSIVESTENGLYNTSVLIDRSGSIIARYRKIHLYGHQSEETKLLKRGTEICVVKCEIGTFGLSTCYDLRFPELYRKMAVMGAEIFLVASAWPFPRLEAWLMLNRVRALENQVFLIASNCTGTNRNKGLVGHSMIVDPWGTPIATGGDEECIVRAEIDIKKVYEAREFLSAFTDRVLID
ncbi:MAG: carbon-nitrogen family hydrolase [Candidatus Binatia bacterium]